MISVDSKKKENVGDYANAGREWELEGERVRVGVHDFAYAEVGKDISYGVLDIGANEGWVNVGDDDDTWVFAVVSIAGWWERMGRIGYAEATRLMITADAGGSNSYGSRAFKVELAKLAATIGLIITVCHMPRGTFMVLFVCDQQGRSIEACPAGWTARMNASQKYPRVGGSRGSGTVRAVPILCSPLGVTGQL